MKKIAAIIANKCKVKSNEIATGVIEKDWFGKPQAPKKDVK
jgi:hypothetical protein